MIKKLILFLIRKKLGVSKYQAFQFVNQKSQLDYYYFNDDHLIKAEYFFANEEFKPAGVSLNWLLDDNCEIRKIQL